MGNSASSKTDDEWKSDAQQAIEAGAFCVICGGPFDLDGDVYNIDPKDPRFQVRNHNGKSRPYVSFVNQIQWLYRLRLVGNTDDVDHVVATPEAT